MSPQEFESKAELVLRDTGTYRVPVAIDVVAYRLGLAMDAVALGAGVSGMLIIEKGRGAIGFNASHAPVRQRFTISHEIAHYLLHVNKSSRKSRLFIDRGVTFRRDEKSSTGDAEQEVEANQLGAALLMPKGLVHEELSKRDLDLDDEEDIAYLAKRFNVSAAAMTNRLTNLRLIH
jgi:Zn-dependent peptidase ImmA (M78 family)